MVVAAHSNRDAYTVPACLMGVLGVSADPQMSGYQYAVQDAAGPEQVQITASSRHALTSPTGRVYETQVTNSYAAPVVTAAVHELLRKSPPLSLTVAEVYEKLAGRQVDISRSRPDFYYRSDCLPSIRGSGLPGGFVFYRAGCGAYGCAVEVRCSSASGYMKTE